MGKSENAESGYGERQGITLAKQKVLTIKQQPGITQNQIDDAVTDLVAGKQKRSRQNLAKFGEENTEPGDNARYLRMARVSMSLPPIDISDPKQVEQRMNEYFDFCESNDRKPSMIGLANWIGIDKTTLSSWKRGEYRNETHSPLIIKAVEMLEELWMDYMQNGKINPASGIFIAKNLFQYKDTADVVLTPNNPMDNLDADAARKRLMESMPSANVDE